MPYYECVYLARQDIAASQVDVLSDGFAEAIAEGGGEVKKREYWGLRNLAYRVKKNRKAHYVLMNIDAPAEAVHEMQRLMRLNADVLRDLTLRVDALNEGPSIMMQRREERRDRGERRSRRDDERRAERAAAAEKRDAGDKAPAEPVPEKAAEKSAEKSAETAPEQATGKPAGESVGEGLKPSPTDAGEAVEAGPAASAAEEAPAENAAEEPAEETAGEGLKPSPTDTGKGADDAVQPASDEVAEKTEGAT